MHIILTVDYSPWSAYSGGAQRVTHNLGVAMSKRGHKVTVIYSKPPWETISVPDDVPYQIHWAHLIAAKSKRAVFLRPLTALSVNRILKKIINPNEDTVVHGNGEETGLVHKIRDHHSFAFICTPHHPHYPEVFFKHKKLPFTTKVFTALKNGKYLMQASAAFHADFCTPPSQWAAEMIGKAFNIPRERLQPVHNGVPDEFLNYHRKPEAQQGPIVFFGRLTKTKGVDTLIEALSLLDPQEIPETWIIGRGEMKQELQEEVEKLKLSKKVIFKSWMDHHELGQVLSKSKLCVLPSREENFSLAVLSSMCVGTPTVSTKVGGTPEIIQNQKNGCLVEADNPTALADSIQYLLEHPDQRQAMGRAGATHIRQNFTWDHACAHFEELYALALENERVKNDK
ncbi:glycosyltransferase family 4 protein [Gracilimonas mengyeensis]|uniref:Glycosyltransferase involved in cell wall bisynthesis n=1 Tax=Gracilimonas mengyeensis TaxID=1302730 RepID=A0A521ABN7_9BACT|nr:glycosyltransferase family 4 protein [Gracilimonas mengyeensis]SMO32239.1 Glycosyltransferase involved in cell wall bisynthesis [Gracilimonas mengyeensis]